MEAANYIAYLLSEPRQSSWVKASAVLAVSHGEVNWFLLNSSFTGKNLFEAVKDGIVFTGGVLTVDDSVQISPSAAWKQRNW